MPRALTYSSASAICSADSQPVGQAAQVIAANGVPKVAALEVLHHDERTALMLAEIEHADDVFVLDIARQLGLLQESGLGFRVLAGVLGKQLQHDRALDDGIARAIDVRHASAQKFKKLVLADGCRNLHSFWAIRSRAPATEPHKPASSTRPPRRPPESSNRSAIAMARADCARIRGDRPGSGRVAAEASRSSP